MNPATGDCWTRGKLSPEGFRFIKGYEGYAPSSYKDSEGYETICYGITKHAEPEIFNSLKAKQPINNEEIGATASYVCYNKNYGEKILKVCKDELKINKQYQFDALVSFSINLGPNILLDRNSLLYKTIKADITNQKAIKDAFNRYVHGGGGAVIPGLVPRRKDEGNMFFGEKIKNRDICIINTSGACTSQKVTTNKGNGWLPDKC